MRKFFSDKKGNFYDLNGKIKECKKLPIETAVEILNEQQKQIEDLLNKISEYHYKDCNNCKHADYCSPTNHKCQYEKEK